MNAKVLTLDIETSPIEAHVWGLWQQNVGLNQILKPTKLLSFAAKWYGKKSVAFKSVHHDGHEEMVKSAHAFLDEADVVVHFNGKKFDIPHLNREIIQAGLTPPSPYRQVDLVQVARRQFLFPSNKLAYVTQALGLSGKLSHTGHDMWIKCLAGDEKAWALMRRYNIQDVRTTEELFDKLRPWVPALNLGVFSDDAEERTCPACGSTNVQRRGVAVTALGRYPRFACQDCGRWSRGKSLISPTTDLRPA